MKSRREGRREPSAAEESSEPKVLRRRRSLTNVGGEIETSGDPREAEILARAIDVPPPSFDESKEGRKASGPPEASLEEDPDRAHVHGFHAYPARAHPVTARRLIEELIVDGGVVLDPFCGGGTILVEAMLAGRMAIGTDLNPIAVMLSRAKTFPHSPELTAALVRAAEGVAAFADERRKAKAGATRRLPPADLAAFAPHVLLELDGLRAGIAEAKPETRPDLSLVLSSILVKLSARKGDTSEESVEKRIAAGYPAKLFVRKTEELARRFDELYALLPERPASVGKPQPRARVFEDDANVLRNVRDASVDGVITSPPYVATYDYLAHHDLRLRWLGLDARRLERGEIGARRRYERLTPRQATAEWEGELERLFRSLARVVKRGGPVVLLIADSAVGGGKTPPHAIRADDVVARVAARGGELRAVARASQPRPHFHAATAAAFTDRPRLEHALLLRRQ